MVHAAVARVGKKSIRFEYELRNGKTNRLIAIGGTTQVFVGDTGSSIEIPEDVRLKFHDASKYQDTEE